MMKIDKSIKITIIGMVLLSVVTTVGYAVNVENKKAEVLQAFTEDMQLPFDKNNRNERITVQGNKLIKLGAPTYENWESAVMSITEDKYNQIVSKERINQLYDEGYGLQDINKALQLTLTTNGNFDAILKKIGKLTYEPEESADQNSIAKDKASDKNKKWAAIEAELGVDTQSEIKKLGLSEKEINQHKGKGLKSEEIMQIAVISKNADKSFDDIYNEYKKSGKKLEDMHKEYIEKKLKSNMPAPRKNPQSLEEAEQEIREQYHITDQEIQKCKEYGINRIYEIGYVKSLSEKHKQSVEKILALKKKNKEWNVVRKVLEGTNIEK
ncbi:hypothetical protein [Petroclostridium sp. X23]|uniref:hypothetical protein n=1 Tax=Petroclostridium sp. X23 TaxID=3045146 RepID=UPI0024AE72BE|nr:hypothetical protein [Petroclostridium sp. X23]WHH58412.1 hypothetical protein QKW49_21835 [Petroclostridium sp. X23]